MSTAHDMPRLLYASDVPVEASVAGSILLYRLLQQYPADKLMVASPPGVESAKKLPGVAYRQIAITPPLVKRIKRTRFTRFAGTMEMILAPKRTGPIDQLIVSFQPDAVLTVAHGNIWFSAVAAARKADLPVHLIVHDEIAVMLQVNHSMQPQYDRVIGENWRAAAQRYVVSPGMGEFYGGRYGGESKVLYPSRAIDAAGFSDLALRLRSPATGPLRIGYAGSVRQQSMTNMLIHLADALLATGSELVLYSPTPAASLQAAGLNQPNVIFTGFVPPDQLQARMREEVDALYVPMSFEEADRINMTISFPSKMTEYTAVGMPLLICGPAYCSAVRWATQDAPGAAEIVTDREPASLVAAIRRLSDLERRRALAKTAMSAGDEFFSHRRAESILFSGLRESGRHA